jgi:hypothetical protein
MIPQPGQIFEHFKGEHYFVIGTGEHTETGEMIVCYQPVMLPTKFLFRPLDMWNEVVEYEGKQVPRFRFLW